MCVPVQFIGWMNAILSFILLSFGRDIITIWRGVIAFECMSIQSILYTSFIYRQTGQHLIYERLWTVEKKTIDVD